jgi:hypothetical protein
MLMSSGHLTEAGQELVAKNYEWVTALSWENKTKLFSNAIKL